jgi:hypothetical protein
MVRWFFAFFGEGADGSRGFRSIGMQGGEVEVLLIGYHPHFIMTAGRPTHFDRRHGEPVAIETYVDLLSDHVAAACQVGLSLIEMRERLVDDR